MRKHLHFAAALARRTAREFLDDGCPQLAAAIAYHALFSLFPLALFLAGFFSLVVNVTGTRTDVVDLIVRQLPLSATGSEQLRAVLDGATGKLSTLGLLGLLGVIYGSSGVMASIRVALNRAWDVRDARPFLRGKLVDLGLVAAVALLALMSITMSVGARALAVAAGALTGQEDAQWIAWPATFAVPLVLGFVASLVLYRFVPARRVRWRDAASAAALVGIALTVGQSLFALYVGHFGDFNAIYGAVGAAMAFMLFVYLGALILLAGAELASELPRVRNEYSKSRRGGRVQLAARARHRRAATGGAAPAQSSDPPASEARRAVR